MTTRRVFTLEAVRADGWFEKLGEGSPNFQQLCEVVGERFLAFSIIAGVRIAGVTVDRRSPDATLIDFVVGDEEGEHRLPLGEFRRRLASTIVAEEDYLAEVPESPTPEDLQAFIGFRFVLLAPLFGIRLAELRLDAREGGAGEDAAVVVDLGAAADEVGIDDFRELLRERVRGEAEQARPTAPFAIDLNAIPRAEKLAAAEDWEGTIDLLGAWPGPLSLLLRTSEGQRLAPDVKASLARAMGLLGTSYVKTSKFDWAEEVMRLGIQWGQDSRAAGDLFRRLGESCVVRDRHGEAIGLLRRALALGAKEKKVLPLLAQSYVARGKFVAAAICLDRAVAAGVPGPDIAGLRGPADEALGNAWAKFRARVPVSRGRR